MTEPRIRLPDRWGLLSPRRLEEQLKEPNRMAPCAELEVWIPWGKTTRTFTVELTAAECLNLAQAAIEAARLLQPGLSDDMSDAGP